MIDAAHVDALALAVSLATAAFGLLIPLVARRRTAFSRAHLRPAAIASSSAAVAFLGLLAVWSARLGQGAPPEEPPIEIDVVARQWIWKVQHPEGRRELNELHLPLGYPVRLKLTSEDVPHALAIPALRVKKVVVSGRETALELTARRAGEFALFCAARCGPHNATMRGRVVITDVRSYLQWARGEVPGESAAEAGRRLFVSLGCETCHRPDGAGRGPALAGLFGRSTNLRQGATVTADEDYLRESIREPDAKVVAGYEPVMPSFAGQLSDSQLNALVAYLRTLDGGTR